MAQLAADHEAPYGLYLGRPDGGGFCVLRLLPPGSDHPQQVVAELGDTHLVSDALGEAGPSVEVAGADPSSFIPAGRRRSDARPHLHGAPSRRPRRKSRPLGVAAGTRRSALALGAGRHAGVQYA